MSLTVICGPMFSGKSTELIRQLERHRIEEQKILCFRPKIDNRIGQDKLYSHDVDNGTVKSDFSVSRVKSSKQIQQTVRQISPDIIAVDEIQFFDKDIGKTLNRLANFSLVYAVGLDTNFRREPFGSMGYLLAVADEVKKLTAVCHVCKGEYGEAVFTQRLDKDGNPTPYKAPIILTGRNDIYEARCRHCHKLPGGPDLT